MSRRSGEERGKKRVCECVCVFVRARVRERERERERERVGAERAGSGFSV